MLKNDFFEIIKKDVSPEKVTATIRLNAAHSIYAGHFPGNPITPGVVQIQMIKEVLEDAYQCEYKLITMSRCKFLKILNPNETPEIIIVMDVQREDGKLKIQSLGQHEESIYFKISAVYA